MLRADLALYDRHGQLAAMVEVKNKLGTSSDWAAQLRRNLLAHGGFGAVRYFLVVTPEWLYLWRDGGRAPGGAPDYAIDVRSFLRPYLERSASDSGRVAGTTLELAVGSWLADLMRSQERFGGEPVARQRLMASGLLDAVRDGRVAYDLAA